MEFGLVMRYGGSAQPKAPESEADEDEVKVKQEETEVNTTVPPSQTPQQSQSQQQQPPPPAAAGAPDAAANATEALVEEDEEDLDLKLAILDIYNERINKRIEIKSLIFDRNLVDYRKVRLFMVRNNLHGTSKALSGRSQNQANDKKRTKEEKDLIMRNKPFARIQTRLDHEAYMDGLLCALVQACGRRDALEPRLTLLVMSLVSRRRGDAAKAHCRATRVPKSRFDQLGRSGEV